METNQSISKREAETRVFLFLQGHPSFFARNVADYLTEQGHKVLRVNFCPGDSLAWWGRPALNYRGRFAGWETHLRKLVSEHQVTDIVYYADRKPYHQIAEKVAQDCDIPTYVYEFGYLRPDWITLERGGMSAFSHFPNDPETIRAIAKDCPDPDQKCRFPYTKPREIFYEVTYNLTSYFAWFLFPFYHSDRYYNPILEYLSGIPGLFLEKRRHAIARKLVSRLRRKRKRIYIFSLQLQSDYQLRSNAPFAHQKEAIELTINSFSENADSQMQLIFKAHPLDNGWERWGRFIKKIANRKGVSDRVHFIVGGNLTFMLNQANGCVLINSTVGIHALRIGCPVKVLGHAVYDIEGATHTDDLDSFWQTPQKPDPDLIHDLVKAMAATIQVKGNFFTTKGQRSAVPAFAKRLLDRSVNAGEAFVSPPPRLATLIANEPPMFSYKVRSSNDDKTETN